MSVWAVLLGAGSASAQPEETEGTCSSYALSPSEATLSSDGGSGTLDLTWDWEAPEVEEFCIANCTNASCGEQTGSVRSSATWLTGTKNGDDQVDYTVAGGYTGSSSREATLTVAGATFTVTQQPPGPCPSSPDRLSSTSLSFPAATSVRYVSVAGRSDCSWSVSGEDWITTPSSVSGGGLVRVQADENPGGAREGTVAIGGSSVSVSQASGCPASPTVSPSSLTFPAAGGTQSLSVTGPARCSWSVSDDRTWITATPPSVSTGGEVTVTVPLGHGGESGTVTIGNQAIPVSVTRTACPRTPGVTPSSLTFPWPGGTQSLSVAGPAHCSWSVSDDRAWITATPSTVPAGGTVQVGVTPGPPGRSGTVAIGRATVPVTVEPCPTSPGVSSTSVSLGSADDVTGTVRLQEAQQCRYTVSESLAWLSVDESSPVAGNATLTFRTEGENDTGAERSGRVMIGGTGVTVTQDPVPAPACPRSPSVSSTSVRLGSADDVTGTVTLRQDQSCRYDVSESLVWLSVDESSPVAGNATVRFRTEGENDTGTERSGRVMIGGTGVTVTQDPVPAPACPRSPSVSSTSVRLGSADDVTGTVTLRQDQSCRYDVSESLVWLSVDESSPVAGNATVRFRTEGENDTGAERSGRVMIGGTGVTVTQDPVPAPACPRSPSVSPTSVRLGSADDVTGTVTLREDQSCRYEVSESLAWLSVDESSPVAGNATVRFRTEGENDTGAERSGRVMIGGTGVTVTQDPVPAPECPTSPSVSPTSVRLGSADDVTGTVTLREDQSCRYDVSESLAWLSVDESSPVAGNATVTFRTEEQNDTGAERAGSVMIGSSSVTVTQGSVACPASPRRILPRQITAPDTGVTFVVALPDVTTCIWEVSDSHDWLATSKLVLSGREKLAVTVKPNGDPASRTGTVTIGSGIVRVDQNGLRPLTAKRDHLLEGYASRNDYGDDVCEAWNSFRATGQEVFIWNTHRLSHTGLLAHVEELHAVYGKGDDCGGGEFNRTFMTMTRELQRKLIDVYYGRDSEFRHWRKTQDFACSPGVVGLACGAKPEWCNCPHRPFNFQIETHAPWPRGQLNFFYPADRNPVERSYFVGEGQFCYSEIRWVTSDSVCGEGESCACGSGDCPRETPDLPSCRATVFRDVPVPVPASFERGPAGDRLTIPSSQRLMFEMDQDYNGRDIHDSAPSCSGMKHVYTLARGNPGWDWRPSDCHDRVRSGFSDGNLTGEATEIRAPHVVELRQRIDAQREFFGLSPFSWTDSTIVAGVTAVRAVHLIELRKALADAYSTAGLVTPTFTDGLVVAGVTPIRVVHLSELLEAIVVLEAQP